MSDSGICGKDVVWTLCKEDGLLTVSGQGGMDDYTGKQAAPRFKAARLIKRAAILEGVTGKGDYAFSNCINMIPVS